MIPFIISLSLLTPGPVLFQLRHVLGCICTQNIKTSKGDVNKLSTTLWVLYRTNDFGTNCHHEYHSLQVLYKCKNLPNSQTEGPQIHNGILLVEIVIASDKSIKTPVLGFQIWLFFTFASCVT